MTRKIMQGHYVHIASGLHITLVEAQYPYWNIWRDEHLTKEYATGFHTKWQAIEYIDTFFKKIN